MRQLLRAGTVACEADAKDDPFRYGWRYVRRTQPDGTEVVDQVPLSLDDLLYPEEGDFVVQESCTSTRFLLLPQYPGGVLRCTAQRGGTGGLPGGLGGSRRAAAWPRHCGALRRPSVATPWYLSPRRRRRSTWAGDRGCLAEHARARFGYQARPLPSRGGTEIRHRRPWTPG